VQKKRLILTTDSHRRLGRRLPHLGTERQRRTIRCHRSL